jgi:tRNA(fMet)-specific endonuclease VapC
MIADSCFIIDLIREEEHALTKLAVIKREHQSQYLTSPTVMELAVGVELAALPREESKKVDDILSGFQVIPLDVSSAWRAGIEIGRLRRAGHIVDPIDAQIAGIALQNDETIITRNMKHFQFFEGLKVESY